MEVTLTRLMRANGVAAMAGALLGGGAVLADDRQQGDNRPPQTLPRGFESIDELQRDAQAAKNEPHDTHHRPEPGRQVRSISDRCDNL